MKRQMTTFTCPKCNSTFDNRYKMNKHIFEQHESKRVLSPRRKVPKTGVQNVDSKKEIEEKAVKEILVEKDRPSENMEKEVELEDMEEETVTKPRKEMENLQDWLVQTGQENELLKNTIKSLNDQIKKTEKRNTSLATKVSNLEKVIATPILGIAVPVLIAGKQEFQYECSLCEKKDMTENGTHCHLQEVHNVRNRKFDKIPVAGEESEERSVVTTAGLHECKQQTVEKKSERKENYRDPNLRELPDLIKTLVEEKSEEYVVKGDGPCLLRTAASHMEGDEEKGPIMARDLNTHLSEYRPFYQDKIGADFPMEVTIGVNGESKKFETSEAYFDWLQESKKAAYMWRNCVDVMALSNMANMDIDVIVYEQGSKPDKFSFKNYPKFP